MKTMTSRLRSALTAAVALTPAVGGCATGSYTQYETVSHLPPKAEEPCKKEEASASPLPQKVTVKFGIPLWDGSWLTSFPVGKANLGGEGNCK